MGLLSDPSHQSHMSFSRVSLCFHLHQPPGNQARDVGAEPAVTFRSFCPPVDISAFICRRDAAPPAMWADGNVRGRQDRWRGWWELVWGMQPSVLLECVTELPGEGSSQPGNITVFLVLPDASHQIMWQKNSFFARIFLWTRVPLTESQADTREEVYNWKLQTWQRTGESSPAKILTVLLHRKSQSLIWPQRLAASCPLLIWRQFPVRRSPDLTWLGWPGTSLWPLVSNWHDLNSHKVCPQYFRLVSFWNI